MNRTYRVTDDASGGHVTLVAAENADQAYDKYAAMILADPASYNQGEDGVDPFIDVLVMDGDEIQFRRRVHFAECA